MRLALYMWYLLCSTGFNTEPTCLRGVSVKVKMSSYNKYLEGIECCLSIFIFLLYSLYYHPWFNNVPFSCWIICLRLSNKSLCAYPGGFLRNSVHVWKARWDWKQLWSFTSLSVKWGWECLCCRAALTMKWNNVVQVLHKVPYTQGWLSMTCSSFYLLSF